MQVRRMRARTLSLAATLSLSVVACGAEPASEPATGEHSQPLLGAPEDPTHLYAAGVCAGELNQEPNLGPVGACIASTPGSPRKRCSGTLVARNLVLTSRGCVDSAQVPAGQPFCNGTFNSS